MAAKSVFLVSKNHTKQNKRHSIIRFFTNALFVYGYK